ncbi:MAG: GNAT family N-acetyltransferase [Candidatus Nanopelagicaceae bacterium]|nr:GNAT family N-acetyltransferase [Candidatus Nanopelagicaceae bacterium]
MKFETKQLICRSLSIADYADFEAGSEPKWDGFTNPYKHLVEGPSPLRHRIPRVKKDPAFAEIGLVLAIADGEIVGSAGFHDYPDENGMIEIGFGIVPEKQGLGYGTELLHGMWRAISNRPDVKILRYTVSPENAPSMHIIKKLEFELVGEQMDDEDGLELIYELPIEEYLKNFHS